MTDIELGSAGTQVELTYKDGQAATRAEV